jgi:primosomal protein N' (replication factor Y)
LGFCGAKNSPRSKHDRGDLLTELYTALEDPSPQRLTPPCETPQPADTDCLLVAVDSPGVGLLSYHPPHEPTAAGDWVVVPVGKRQLVGLVVDLGPAPVGIQLKQAVFRCGRLPTCSPTDLAYYKFVATYYRRQLGQVLGTAIPTWLRQPGIFQGRQTKKGLSPSRLDKILQKPVPSLGDLTESTLGDSQAPGPLDAKPLQHQHRLTEQQQQALAVFDSAAKPVLLHGITGSGKTQVYLSAMEKILAADAHSQVALLVPEIGLTQALIQRLAAHFPHHTVAVLHSGLPAQSRAHHWLNAATGRARIVLGTRTAILCPMPRLALLVVDEEHDHSYKQQEGLRYSARDLAVWLADQRQIRLLLGSATPSLESRAQVARGRYQLVRLTERATGAPPARVRLVDLIRERPVDGLAPSVWQAIEHTLAKGQQVLVYANRRGWAPVLACSACGWQQTCQACRVASVLHKTSGRWRSVCHHCAAVSPIPKSCPDCGAPELEPLGRGSQRLEQSVSDRLPGAKVLRLDRDAMTSATVLAQALDQVARGEVDLVIGTQMVAKGHDFPTLALVVVVDADQQLYNPDFRAPEWLLANLVQVAGRAGRHTQGDDAGQVLVQTRYPTHPILQALASADSAAQETAWESLLEERQAAGLPPFGHLAAIRFSHRDASLAQAKGLELTASIRATLAAQGQPTVMVFPPTPRYPDHQAGRSRWQVFLESSRRAELHAALDAADAWLSQPRSLDPHVEIDPLNFS